MPAQAIKEVCEDPEPVSHSYMDLSPEARALLICIGSTST